MALMSSYNAGADTGLIVTAVIVDILLIGGLYVWTALALNALFRKAGEPGWAGWVPYFNTAVLLKLGGFSPYFIFFILVPVIGPVAVWVMLIIATYRINVAFGYREGGAVGMTFLGALLLPVWASVLGWGSARWVGPDPRLRAAAVGAYPGAAFAPAYQQPAGGYAAQPGQPGYGAGYTPVPGAFAPAPQGHAPSAPPAESVPSAAVPPAPSGTVPSGAVPPGHSAADESTADAPRGVWSDAPRDAGSPASAYTQDAAAGLFASLYATPVDEDLEGVDDPVPVRRRSGIETETVADPPAPVTPQPAAGPVIDAVPVVDAAPVSAASTRPVPAPAEPGPEDTASDGGRPGAAAPAPAVPAAPVSAAPSAASAAADPWAPPAPVPAAQRSPAPTDPADFSDTAAEVSAVAGAPMGGVPMSARSSVSALRAEPELPDAESAFDETIIAPRRRTEWMLTPPLGAPIRLTAPVLILGRRPAADPEYPNAQLIDIADETRTVSKTHARLELAAERWTITDLGSTNGVVLVADDGTETDLPAGASQLLGERFLLGDAELRLTRGKE